MDRNQYPLPKWTVRDAGNDREFAKGLRNWRAGAGPAYRRLADAIRGTIESGQVPEGARLPAERTLARLLSLSRTTVVGAYERLREGGWVESRQGSGTRARRPDSQTSREPGSSAAGAGRVYRVLTEAQRGTIEFLGAYLPGPSALDERLLSAGRDAVQSWAREPGYFPLGLPELRRQIARHLTRSGLATTEEQVLVTSGAQQAIGLAGALYVQRGDSVVVEDPTYVGAIDVFHSLGARLVSLPVGPQGVRVEEVRLAVERSASRLIYVMPTFQNPTGAVLPEKQRRQLARFSEELQVPILEDNTLADLWLEEAPPAPVAAFSARAPILTVGSLSKLFWGGLRIGWIRASEPIVARLAPLKSMADLGSSVLSQAAAIQLFQDVDRIRAVRRREIAERLERLAGELSGRLPSWSFQRPAGGLSLWVRLPHGSAAEFARIALRHGVSLLPGSVASPEGRFADCLRLPFVLEADKIQEGVERLARAWDAYAPPSNRERRRLGVLV